MLFNVYVLAFAGIFMCSVPTGHAQAPECSAGADLVPHPTICQRYTNCSVQPPYPTIRYLQAQEDECRYPQLFDINLLKCIDFKLAECGPSRVASKDPCGYVKNMCGSAHCEPCSSRWPPCVGLADGTHEHPFKQWSPYYIVCDTERTVSVAVCPTHTPSGTRGIFSPIKNKCVSLWEIPPEHGGQEPSCQGLGPGLHRVTYKPDVYFSCPGPNVWYCGVGLEFNETTQVCQKSGVTTEKPY